jgi:hypothetical protein
MKCRTCGEELLDVTLVHTMIGKLCNLCFQAYIRMVDRGPTTIDKMVSIMNNEHIWYEEVI